jgi:hypothetical protein
MVVVPTGPWRGFPCGGARDVTVKQLKQKCHIKMSHQNVTKMSAPFMPTWAYTLQVFSWAPFFTAIFPFLPHSNG